MADEAIDRAVEAALTARANNDVAGMNAAFDAAWEAAESRYPEGVQPSPAPSSTETGERISPEALDEIASILSGTGNSDMCDARLGNTVQDALSFAQQFEKSNPALADEIAELAASDARVYAMVLKYCAAQHRAAPKAAPSPARTNPDTSYAPVAPILSERESIQDQIAAMATKLDTAEGRTAKFQRQWSALHSELYGEGPMVGRLRRTA